MRKYFSYITLYIINKQAVSILSLGYQDWIEFSKRILVIRIANMA